jgi:hypothetical protein
MQGWPAMEARHQPLYKAMNIVFVICTDHQSLSYLTEQHLHSEMQRKAMTRLMGLQFKVVYNKGKDNVVADALSRVSHLLAISTVSVVQPLWFQEVINSYVTDPVAQDLLAKLSIQSPDEQGFSLSQGLIRFNNKIWIAQNSTFYCHWVTQGSKKSGDGYAGVQGVVTKLAGDAAHGDGDVGCQNDVTKVAYDAVHGDGDTGCQDSVTKVACSTAHGDGDAGSQDDDATLAAEVMGSDRNPS